MNARSESTSVFHTNPGTHLLQLSAVFGLPLSVPSTSR